MDGFSRFLNLVTLVASHGGDRLRALDATSARSACVRLPATFKNSVIHHVGGW